VTEYVARKRSLHSGHKTGRLGRLLGRPATKIPPWGLYRHGVLIGVYWTAEEAVAAMPLAEVEVLDNQTDIGEEQ
jgi:hypothetical protein